MDVSNTVSISLGCTCITFTVSDEATFSSSSDGIQRVSWPLSQGALGMPLAAVTRAEPTLAQQGRIVVDIPLHLDRPVTRPWVKGG